MRGEREREGEEERRDEAPDRCVGKRPASLPSLSHQH